MAKNNKKLYLITGFLGAGKTTLLNSCFAMLSAQRVAVIVNEFGKQGVDGQLLSQRGYEVTQITNGSIFCVCRMDLFIEVLIEAGKTDAELILVETSGLSDPRNIKDVLAQVKAVCGIEFDYRGCIAVADAKNLFKVLDTAVVTAEQLKSASLIIVNKADLVDQAQLNACEVAIRTYNPYCELVFTSYCKIDGELLEGLSPLNQGQEAYNGKIDLLSQSITISFPNGIGRKGFEELLEHLKPIIFRLKGYVTLDGACYLADGVAEEIKLIPLASWDGISINRLVVFYNGKNQVKVVIKEQAEKSDTKILFE